ncbi:LAMI_0F00826g1_1 [Lachancea mirantina]|uniref:LAMI_0F00826g1_1 n=1 Tax=Lachancea mirantina TaxID=1230905 RepID=A0A1G4JVK4_9SACH|nr:LAMI_0F00826g1_1 [Lachancea mirantina]
MRFSEKMVTLASLMSTFMVVASAQQYFQDLGYARKPHAVKLNPSLTKRETAPAFGVLQDEWSAEVANASPRRFEKSTAVDELCKKDVHNVESAADMMQILQKCKHVDGSIHVLEYSDPIIDLGSLQSIGGDLILQDLPMVVRLQGPNLANIGGELKLHSLTSLVGVSLPHLQHFDALDWRVVPTLTSVELAPNVSSAKRIIISDTSLTALEGFEFIEELEVFNINNNRYMETVKSNLKRVHEQLSVSANFKEIQVEFPHLIWAKNLTVRDVSSISLDSLQYVNQSLEVIENYFETFSVPELKSVGGTLGVIENPKLHSVDFANLTNIHGGFMLANNSLISQINFLPELREIGGAIQFMGAFQNIECPKLRLVRGSALIQSTSSALDCSKWTSAANGNSIIRGGRIICTSGKRQNSVRVHEDGSLFDHHESEQAAEETKKTKEANMSSFSADTSKLSVFAWSLGLGWIIALLFIATSQ